MKRAFSLIITGLILLMTSLSYAEVLTGRILVSTTPVTIYAGGPYKSMWFVNETPASPVLVSPGSGAVTASNGLILSSNMGVVGIVRENGAEPWVSVTTSGTATLYYFIYR